MATFVLVGGAWIGAWAWKDVANRLRAAGHVVYPLSLTGLGERVHLARPEVDLETHIADVVNLIAYESLGDVILCGHSYAGIVVPGVGDRIPEHLSQVVYVDSAPLEDGQAFVDLFPPDALRALREAVDADGDGWKLPFPGTAHLADAASTAGLDHEALALLEAKATPQPWATYTRPLRLTRQGEPTYRRAVVACDDVRSMVAAGIPPIVAMTQAPWRYEEIATGHWPMLSAPEELAATLDRIGRG